MEYFFVSEDVGVSAAIADETRLERRTAPAATAPESARKFRREWERRVGWECDIEGKSEDSVLVERDLILFCYIQRRLHIRRGRVGQERQDVSKEKEWRLVPRLDDFTGKRRGSGEKAWTV